MTDPDSGLFVKGEHKRQFAYEAHTVCDKHGFVLEAVITPGNVHDSVAFDEVYDRVTEAFPEVETIVADSAYKTPHICKKVFEDGRVLSTAYKRPQTMKGGHEWWKYVYDEHYDCVLCPEHQVLSYRTTNRDGYREYRSDPKICVNCPPATCAPIPKTVSKRYSDISGRTMRNWRTTPAIRLSTENCTNGGRRPLNGSLPTQKKNTPCVILSIEAWPRCPTG